MSNRFVTLHSGMMSESRINEVLKPDSVILTLLAPSSVVFTKSFYAPKLQDWLRL
jgi:hypothetical protein